MQQKKRAELALSSILKHPDSFCYLGPLTYAALAPAPEVAV